MKVNMERSKRGLPCLWESGGAGSNTGHATVIAGEHGQRLQALFCPHGGHLSNGQHALIVVKAGYLVIRASQWRGDVSVQVCRIDAVDDNADTATLTKLAELSAGEWDTEPEQCWFAAIQAAISKASCYHCRSVFFANARPIAALAA